MKETTNFVLAAIALVILSLAFSTFKWGARIVQGVLIIAIIVVVLRNESIVQRALGGVTGIIYQNAEKSSDSGGD